MHPPLPARRLRSIQESNGTNVSQRTLRSLSSPRMLLDASFVLQCVEAFTSSQPLIFFNNASVNPAEGERRANR